jgi:hypothetical protein
VIFLAVMVATLHDHLLCFVPRVALGALRHAAVHRHRVAEELNALSGGAPFCVELVRDGLRVGTLRGYVAIRSLESATTQVRTGYSSFLSPNRSIKSSSEQLGWGAPPALEVPCLPHVACCG